MTRRELFKFWLGWKNQDEEERERKINTLMSANHILTREALVSEMAGKREEARGLRTASHEIDKLIGRMEAAALRQE